MSTHLEMECLLMPTGGIFITVFSHLYFKVGNEVRETGMRTLTIREMPHKL